MGRTKKVFHAVWSGYALTAIVSLASFITYPIAVAVLGKTLFGLWSNVLLAVGFAGIFDMGLGPSLARFITDYKDDRRSPDYAAFLKSVFLVGLVQGVLFLCIALVVIQYLPAVMGIRGEQSPLFKTLLLWQLGPVAAGFPLRPLSQLLYANQQIAKLNACNLVSVTINTVVLLAGLKLNWGIYSYVAASWAALIVTQCSTLALVVRAGLLPDFRGAKVSLKILKPLASFSANMFFIVIGNQLILFSPGLLVTRHLGLPAMADWNFGTRLFLLVGQIVGRVPNASEPAFWEMFSRNELPTLRRRLLDMVLVAGSAAALLSAGIVAINGSFVELWSSRQVDWVLNADLCLGAWVFLMSLMLCFNMAPGITKRIGALKFVYIGEGLFLVALAYASFVNINAPWKVALALAMGICLFRLPYGMFRTSRDLGVPRQQFAGTLVRLAVMALSLFVLALAFRFLTNGLPALGRLAVTVPVFPAVALPLVFKFGLPSEYQQRIRRGLSKFIGRPQPA